MKKTSLIIVSSKAGREIVKDFYLEAVDKQQIEFGVIFSKIVLQIL